MSDAIEGFIDHVLDTDFAHLSPEVVNATKVFLLDTLGVGVVGSAGPWVAELIETTALSMPGQQARAWVHGTPLSAAGAAMCNGYQIHNSEFDCVHEAAVVHCVTVPLAATMAVAERVRGVSGKTLIAAIALGVDVACHLSVAVTTGLRFFRPATAGGMGAVASIGKVLGLDRETLRNAFGVMQGQLCGTMQAHTEGSLLLPLQMGFNARNAVLACDIATRGLVAPHQVLEGNFGYYALFEGAHRLHEVLPSVGRLWRITEVAHKPFPSGRATHGVIDGCLELKAEFGFGADEIKRVKVRIPPLVERLVGRPITDDMHANYARLCIPYVLACALLHDGVWVDDFLEMALRDPIRLALSQKIIIEVDDNPDPNALTPVTVDIECEDGMVFTRTIDTVYGNPAKPMTRKAQQEKLRRNFQGAAHPLTPGAMEALSTDIDRLENVCDVSGLVDHLVV